MVEPNESRVKYLGWSSFLSAATLRMFQKPFNFSPRYVTFTIAYLGGEWSELPRCGDLPGTRHTSVASGWLHTVGEQDLAAGTRGGVHNIGPSIRNDACPPSGKSRVRLCTTRALRSAPCASGRLGAVPYASIVSPSLWKRIDMLLRNFVQRTIK